MTGLMSLWTAPESFNPTRELLLLHTLAFCYVRKHFEWTELVTDEAGYIIADRLRWDYGAHTLHLEQADDTLDNVWSAGKLYAQLAQKEPYCHVDNDILLHAPFPTEATASRIFCQSKDEEAFYLTGWAQHALKIADLDSCTACYNTGIIGGQDVTALHAYCKEALSAMKKLAGRHDPQGVAILAEQAAFGQFCRANRIKPYELIPLPLSARAEDFPSPFTHLWSKTKRSSKLLESVERKLAEDFPKDYENFNRGFPLIPDALRKRKIDTWHPVAKEGENPFPKVAVVVTCHEPYLKYLPQCIESIGGQGFESKVLIYDRFGEEEAPVVPDDWGCLVGGMESVNQARNVGTDLAVYSDGIDWICFWDADNTMPDGCLRKALDKLRNADDQTAVLYPQVRDIDLLGNTLHLHASPEWTKEAAQEQSLCDTASFWRVKGLQSVSGWNEAQVDHDDYELALRLFRNGWTGQKSGLEIQRLQHGKNRSSRKTHADQLRTTESLWTAWQFTFITLWSGSNPEAHERLMEWYERAELPPHSRLLWLDNSGGEMKAQLLAWIRQHGHRFEGATYIPGGNSHIAAHGEEYLNFERHDKVSRLYNQALQHVITEMVVTVEDDTIPPLCGLRELMHEIRPGSKVGCSSGVYRARLEPDRACCSMAFDKWDDVPLIDALPKTPFEVGMTGGGFAVYPIWSLRKCLPFQCTQEESGLLGWDGNLGLRMRKAGYKLIVNPEVFCTHDAPEVTAFLEKMGAFA